MPRRGRPMKAAVEREFESFERAQHNDFVSAGMSRRLVPPIVLLRNKGLDKGGISIAEWAALDYYREQAHKAQDDEAQASVLAPERIMGGSSRGIPSGIPARLRTTPAILETARIERDLGALSDIARAIAVEDVTLTAWCIRQYGGRETVRHDRTIMVPRGTNDGVERMKVARMELRMAAHRITRGA